MREPPGVLVKGLDGMVPILVAPIGSVAGCPLLAASEGVVVARCFCNLKHTFGVVCVCQFSGAGKERQQRCQGDREEDKHE